MHSSFPPSFFGPDLAAPGIARRDFLQAGVFGAAAWSLLRSAPAARETAAAAEPVEIGARPQLFLDDFIVDNRWSLKPKQQEVLRAFHAPKKHGRNPLFIGDGGYVNVVRDAQSHTLKMWYQTHQWLAAGAKGHDYAIAYAESTDGLDWQLPELGLYEWKGTRANNIVWMGKDGRRASGAHVMAAPEHDPHGYRFIMCYHSDDGIRAVGSADGIHWDIGHDTLLTALHSDTQNCVVYDEAAGEFVMYCRPKDRYLAGAAGDVTDGARDVRAAGESRRIARLSGKSLWQPWSGVPETILIPDELDMQRGFNRFYGMSVKEFAGIQWGFVWPFKLNTDIVTELAWSRDGWGWQRLPTRPRLLELGPAGSWDAGMVFGSADWIEAGDEWWIYYSASDGPHESRERKAGIGLATIRKEGFISLYGPSGGGVVCTRQIRWPGGRLLVNADSRAGELRVRLSGDRRKPLPGFDYADCDPLAGDGVAQEITWKGKGLTAGQIVRLEFFLRDAELYSFRAETAEGGKS
jgi:hypothetical protein